MMTAKPKHKNYFCDRCKKEITRPAQSIKPKCMTCGKLLIYVSDFQIDPKPKEQESNICLVHGDNEQYTLPKGTSKDVIVNMPQSGTIWIRLLQDEQSGHKEGVILVAHGRQAGPPARTVDTKFAMRSFAYMTPLGHQLLRQYYEVTLPKCVSKFQSNRLRGSHLMFLSPMLVRTRKAS